MAINQSMQLKLQQKLSPMQIQLIKLLEIPTVQMEQRIKEEIESNPVLEVDEEATRREEEADPGRAGWHSCGAPGAACLPALVVAYFLPK